MLSNVTSRRLVVFRRLFISQNRPEVWFILCRKVTGVGFLLWTIFFFKFKYWLEIMEDVIWKTCVKGEVEWKLTGIFSHKLAENPLLLCQIHFLCGKYRSAGSSWFPGHFVPRRTQIVGFYFKAITRCNLYAQIKTRLNSKARDLHVKIINF